MATVYITTFLLRSLQFLCSKADTPLRNDGSQLYICKLLS